MSTSKKRKTFSKINLPEDVVQWVEETFTDAVDRNSAYKYALSAFIQVQKMPQRKEYRYICLPKSVLVKHITDKNLWRIKKVFAGANIIYKEGWKKTPNKKYMNKYSFDEEKFLSKLKKVEVWAFQKVPQAQETNINKSLPHLSKGEGGGIDNHKVYMGCNLSGSGQTQNYLQNKTHKNMKKKINMDEVKRLLEQGVSLGEIAKTQNCSRRTLSRYITEHNLGTMGSMGNTNNQLPEKAQPQIIADMKFSVPDQTRNQMGNARQTTVVGNAQPQRPKWKKPFPHITNPKFSAKDVEHFTVDNLRSLKFDIAKLQQLIPGHVASSLNSIKVIDASYEVVLVLYKYLNGTTEYYGYTDKILQGLKPTESLLLYKGTYIIGDLQTFKTQKQKEIQTSLQLSLQQLSNLGCMTASLNLNNGRLNSPITNLWKAFREEIMKDNNLCEIDIVNSQMVFLSTDMELIPQFSFTHQDVKDFIGLAACGKLYEYMAIKMQISRAEAKSICLEVLFCSHKARTKKTAEFKTLFPMVYEYLVTFKKHFGDNQLAIRLQLLEAKFMVFGVLKTLMDRDIFGITIHDSVICYAEDVNRVYAIIQHMMHCDYKFQGTLTKNYPKPKATAPVSEIPTQPEAVSENIPANSTPPTSAVANEELPFDIDEYDCLLDKFDAGRW